MLCSPAQPTDAVTLHFSVSIGQIVAGFDGGIPAEIQRSLAAVVNAGTAITGAYIWNLDGLDGTPSDFANAINAGLAGTTTSS